MGKIEYSLFRVKMIQPQQTSFLHDNLTPRQILEASVMERPHMVLHSGSHTWHIGNVEQFPPDSGSFKFGRTSKTTNVKFDQEKGEFIEEDFETSPYTYVVFNSKVGFFGIAHHHRLAQKVTGIAKKLEKVLQQSEVVRHNGIEVIIAPISDPDTFLRQIASAHQVLRFCANFTGPNPFDADEYFQRPLSVYASKVNASRGRTQVEGEDLDKDVVKAVAKSTAASGNKVSARIRRSENQAPTNITLETKPISRQFEAETHEPKLVITELEGAYAEVRHAD